MSVTEALEMMSSRSRSFSSAVHAVLLGFFVLFSPESCSFFGISTLAVPMGIELMANAAAQGKALRNKRRSIRLPS